MFSLGHNFARPAKESDLDSLCHIEESCFTGNRISRRQFIYHIKSPGSRLIVLPGQGTPSPLLGYALILLRQDSARARLYSLAVLPEMRGQGLAQKLIDVCEVQCRKVGRSSIYLEVREDNFSAQQLYLKLGYVTGGHLENYYEDQASALRLQKRLES